MMAGFKQALVALCVCITSACQSNLQTRDAEAALVAGDLAKALDEISTLPDPAQAALADWVSVARTRQAAIAAADALAQSLNSN